MYHAQTPPPDRIFKPEVPGITWVDWVFPFFLFALGAAIPFHFGPKADRQEPQWMLVLEVVKRGVLLALFALVSQHFRPGSLSPTPENTTYVMAILYFLATVAAFVRVPDSWPKLLRFSIPAVGWLIIFIGMFAYPGKAGGPYFDFTKSDIILLVLANVSITAPLIWLATRRSPNARVAIVALVAAIFLAKDHPGIIKDLYTLDPLPKLFVWDFQKYLMIVIPGTLCGDLLLRHKDFKEPLMHTPGAAATVTAVGLLLSPVITGLLFTRHVEIALIVATLVATLGMLLSAWACHFSDGMRGMLRIGSILLLAGIIFDPVNGGIKKDPANISYMLTLSGLAFWMVAAFTNLAKVRSDEDPRPIFSLKWLEQVGINPILGYTVITNLLPAILRLPEKDSLSINAFVGLWGGKVQAPFQPLYYFGYALFSTAIVCLVCIIATRKRIFLRA
jgi:predicted acyltransferase